ncbi:MAG: xanthine phosphoribosyltransferase, partial [Candidatus Scatosoma sp.]
AQVYTSKVMSYTHGKVYDIIVSTEYLKKGDRVLIIDDFLANGKALIGLIDICNQAGAVVVGCGIAIEKAFQGGGDALRKQGIRIESLAKIASMTENSLTFAD